ncbi:MAG TPA: deoxyribodipyrimidine photo-lyase [Bacteroidia bacterium]|jgi:deoxyribodipyrimidine photo-lyase
MTHINIFWFRRDLRLEDNTGLYHALKEGRNVLPVFIFDPVILNQLENKEDRRVEFILLALKKLQEELAGFGSSLLILHGKPSDVFQDLLKKYSLVSVYANHDYEPYAISRDDSIGQFLAKNKIIFKTYKDQVIFEKHQITKDDNQPYTVFTPYMKKWKSRLSELSLQPHPTEKYFSRFLKTIPFPAFTLKDIGFKPTGIRYCAPSLNEGLVRNYNETRNFPSVDGTSRLSVHLRFGTVSIRALVSRAAVLNEQWLNELIWREFYMMILFHFPHAASGAFKKKYENIPWRNNEKDFEAWCKGQTGYPIVDAGMRELNATGFMHNRVRMITAGFLVKHLLIDWRWGEAYFAEKLSDFDLAANNGGWQWAAGSGCDATPYFRVFNPYEQTKRFDPDYEYTRKWVPEFKELTYAQPIVENKFARERVLGVYKKALNP